MSPTICIVPLFVACSVTLPSGKLELIVPVEKTRLPRLLEYATPVPEFIKVNPVVVDGVSPNAGCACVRSKN